MKAIMSLTGAGWKGEKSTASSGKRVSDSAAKE
jgi:hypothetical protein